MSKREKRLSTVWHLLILIYAVLCRPHFFKTSYLRQYLFTSTFSILQGKIAWLPSSVEKRDCSHVSEALDLCLELYLALEEVL